MRSRGQDVDDAQAAYLEAKANVEAARLNLEYTTIRSPVNGKTGPILIQPGNMVIARVNAHHQHPTANPLVTINEIQPIKISLVPAPVRPAAHPGAAGKTRRAHHRHEHARCRRRRHQGAGQFRQQRRRRHRPAPSSCAPAMPTPTWRWCRASWWIPPSMLAEIPNAIAGAARSGQYRPGRPVRLCGEGRRGPAAPGQA